jgi:small ligand-binding sensory domain FIST
LGGWGAGLECLRGAAGPEGRAVSVSGVRFASGLSEHPVAAHAVGELAGQVLESVGPGPDLAAVFVSPAHAGALEDIAGAVQALLSPTALIGCAACSVTGTSREVEDGPAISLWAGRVGPVLGAELALVGDEVVGWPDPLPFEPQAVVLLADPFSFAAEQFFAWLGRRHPGLPVVGGNASAAAGPGGNRLAVGARVVSSGAVAALLGPGARLTPVVSQGCRPVGRPLAVTAAEGNVIYQLAGRPPLERLMQLAEGGLTEEEVAIVNSGGLHLGVVIDEHKEEFGRGDFLIRNVIGADRSTGAMAVGDEVAVGTTVQFHLRDAISAHEDLCRLMSGRRAEAALMFTCNGRGTRMFGRPDHDASVVSQALGSVPAAGMFAAGEFGPVGGANFVHGFTTSLALFGAVR